MGSTCSAPPPQGGMGHVKIYGMPVSMNSCGPIILAQESGAGDMELMDIMKGAHKSASFAKINPSQQIPAMQDGTTCCGESTAMLRYLAMKYATQYYPVDSPETCVKIDFAMDAFTSNVYPAHVNVVYVCFNFKGLADGLKQDACNKEYTEKIEKWCKDHLKGKFVTGDTVSIADFKVVPFMFSAIQPAVSSKLGFKPPQRAVKYCEDFCAAVGASKFLKEAGGFSIQEYAATLTK